MKLTRLITCYNWNVANINYTQSQCNWTICDVELEKKRPTWHLKNGDKELVFVYEATVLFLGIVNYFKPTEKMQRGNVRKDKLFYL